MRCGREIPDERHYCDEYKRYILEKKQREKVVFSPNKAGSDSPLSAGRIILLCLLAVEIIAVLLIIYFSR